MTEWGNNYEESAALSDNNKRAAGGLFNPGANQQLDSFVLYVQDVDSDVRAAVYESTAETMANASLVEDMGILSCTTGWNTWTSSGNPTLTDGKYLFLCFKTNDGGNFKYDLSSLRGDFTSRWSGGQIHVDNDETVAWPSTEDENWSSAATAISVYINHSALGGSTTKTDSDAITFAGNGVIGTAGADSGTFGESGSRSATREETFSEQIIHTFT